MRKVLHKVKSNWIVLGVMGATVVALGAADVQKVSAAEVEGAGVIETSAASISSSVSNDPVTFSMEETFGEEVPNTTVELADSNLNESQEAVLEEGVAPPQNDTPAVSYTEELEGNVALNSIEETVVATEVQDVTAPVIDESSIKVSQTAATLGETITLSANISDDVGVTEVKAQYYLPTGIKTIVNLHKNEESGLYEGTITVDNSTQSGNWRLNRLVAYDAAGNSTSSDTDYSNLSAANFSVTGTTVDSRNPVIYPESVKVSQTSVTAGDTVIVSANITDDVGVTYGVVSYQSPTGLWSSVELFKNETSGLYEGTINVDASTQFGDWKLLNIVARDAAGNSLYIRSYDCDFSAADFTVTTDGNDVTNPIIDVSSIKVSQPSAVPGDTITISANITDNVGVTLGRANYKDPAGSLQSVNLLKNEITGFYEGMISIDGGTFSGNWSLASITAYDAAGNETTLSKGEVELSAANFTVSGTLNVVSPPVIDETSINVSQKSAIPGNLITVSAKLTDDADVSQVLALYYSPTEVIMGTILSKNEISGLFEGTIYVDNYTQEGTWNIDSIVVFYNTGSAAGFYRDDVDFSAASFTVTGTYASIIPVLDASSIKVSKAAVVPGETITVSAKLTNDVDVDYLIADYYYSQIENRRSVYLYKNEISGLYEGTISTKQFTQSGNWKLDFISAQGAAGNLASFSDYDFSAANFVVPSSTSESLEITETIAYGTKQIEDSTLPIGNTVLIRPGMNGSKKDIYTVTYVDGVEVLRELTGTSIITAPITEVIKVGTQQKQTVNLAIGATLNSSVPFDNLVFAGDKKTDNTTEYARATSGLQWVQMDLGAAYDLNEIQLWHYYGDGRSYHDVVVQLSNDASFSTGAVTIFNNDTNGSAGLGLGTDSEYSETSAGKTISFSTVSARYARFYSNGSTVNGANHYVEIEVYGIEPQTAPTVNLASEGTLSSSVPFDNSAFATDKLTDDTADYARGTSGLQWMQVDLGASYDLNEIQLWHYYGDGRSYHDVVVQLSNDASFSRGIVTVFNNDKNGSAGLGLGTDSEYRETTAGKTIAFDTVNARYARFYSNGSTVNGANHYVEIEVYGVEPKTLPTVNLVPEGTLSSSVPFDNSAFATDKLTDDTADYARGTSGLQWVQVDLGASHDLNEVKLWHYYGDGRSYRDVVVQLSNDASFSSGIVTVFNNDTSGSAGLGVGTDSEYRETSAGKTINFAAVNARYARFYSNGSTVNGANHYVEIEVYGIKPQPLPIVNLAPEGTLSSSVPFDNSAFATDELADDTADYARGASGLQWMQVDLGASYDLNEIQLWHYYGDGRSYHDVVVLLSNDATFANGAVTVFNNDTNGSAGLGVGTDSEYRETSEGKTILFDTINARYARFYSNGSTVNGANHYVEIEVYGSESMKEVEVMPELTGLTFDKDNVQTGGSIQITTTVTGDVSEGSIVLVHLQSESRKQNKNVELTKTADGTYIGNYDVNEYSEAGIWNIVDINLRDNTGDYSLPFTNPSTRDASDKTFLVENETGADMTAPVVQNISLDKNSVRAGERIQITATLTDDLSGVDYAKVTLKPANTYQGVSIYLDKLAEATYVGYYDVNEYAKSGTWQIGTVEVYDAAGNGNYTTGDAQFEVVNDGAEDVTAPYFKNISFNKEVVKAGEQIQITVTVTDDLSGVNMVNAGIQSFENENIVQAQNINLHRTADDTFVGYFKLDEYAAAGTWGISGIYATDNLENSTDYIFGRPDWDWVTFEVENELQDVTAPRIESIVLDKDVAKPGERVQITATVTDDLSGVDPDGVSVVLDEYIVTGRRGSYTSVQLYKTSGNTYVGYYDVGDSTPVRELNIIHAYVADNIGNYASMDSADLIGDIYDTTFVVEL